MSSCRRRHGNCSHTTLKPNIANTALPDEQIVPGGIAARSGKLRMGDRILQVNGNDVTAATHQEAVMELLRPSDDIKLFVQHDPLPVGFQVIYIHLYVWLVQYHYI